MGGKLVRSGTGVISVCAIGGQNIRKLYTVLSSLGVVFLMSIFGNCICLATIVVSRVFFASHLNFVCTSYLYLLYCVYCCPYFRRRTAG
jgi:hypothetical protein